MKYDDERSEWIFPGGTRVYAHSNSLGIDTAGEVSYGWDGSLDIPNTVPSADRRAMADMMIARWTKYKEEA